MAFFSAAMSSAFAFTDTEEHWAAEYIDILSKEGLVKGFESGEFRPDDAVTTEQFVAMALRSVRGEIAPTSEGWASGYMDYALANGIIDSIDIHNAEKKIERRDVARIVHEILRREYGEMDDENWRSADRLEDLYDCSACVAHVSQIYVKGIMNGKSDNFFDNYGLLTRAEAAAVIVRMMDKEKRIPPKPIRAAAVTEITPERAEELTADGALLVDVRDSESYMSGHIMGSVNIPISELIKNPYVTDNKRRPLIFYCARGYNSEKAARISSDFGYSEVYIIPGTEIFDYELVK